MHLARRIGRDWERTPVPAGGLSILRGETAHAELVAGLVPGALAVVVPLEEDGAPRAALLSVAVDASLLVSGFPPLGVHLLAERDELIVGADLLWFTSREPARSQRYAPGAEPASCARCRQRLEVGDSFVACPACRAPHHGGIPAGDGIERRCWDHAPHCAACGRDRDDASWTPEDAA